MQTTQFNTRVFANNPSVHASQNKPRGLTFQGGHQWQPEVFALRPDFNQSEAPNRRSAGLRTVDYWA